MRLPARREESAEGRGCRDLVTRCALSWGGYMVITYEDRIRVPRFMAAFLIEKAVLFLNMAVTNWNEMGACSGLGVRGVSQPRAGVLDLIVKQLNPCVG